MLHGFFFLRQHLTCHISYVKCPWVKCVPVFTPLSVCVPVRVYVCVCATTSGEASKSPSPLRTLSACQNQGCELFPLISLMSLAPSRGYHTGELCREGSLALANKHMHMPPLAHPVPSNLHAIMRFFIIWHSKIIFLMYEGAWLGFSFKDFVFIAVFFIYFLPGVSHFSNFNGDIVSLQCRDVNLHYVLKWTSCWVV